MVIVIATEFVGPLLLEWQPENPFVCMPSPSPFPIGLARESLLLYPAPARRDDVAPHDR